MAISNISNVKTYLGIESTNVVDDALLAILMARAQGIIEAETGKRFDVTTETTLSFSDKNVEIGTLYFDEMCASITTITNGDGVVVPSTQYTTHPQRHAPYFAVELKWNATTVWDTWSGDITVKGKWGYSTSAPSNVVQACDRLTMYLYRTKDNADSDRIMFTDQGMIAPGALPSDVMRLLVPYKART
jgi:hypothetical protein